MLKIKGNTILVAQTPSDACCPIKMEYSTDGDPGSIFVLQRNVSETIKLGCVLDGCVYLK